MFAGFPLSGLFFGIALYWYTDSHGENVPHPPPIKECNLPENFDPASKDSKPVTIDVKDS